jgi:hypothetical protein
MKKLNYLLIFTLFFYSCVTKKSFESPFIGTWEANIDGCKETWVFENNSIRKSFSYEEETVNNYTFSKVKDGIYEVVDTRISSNFKTDCTGEISETQNGHVSRIKIKFLDKDTFILCFPEMCLDKYPFKRIK